MEIYDYSPCDDPVECEHGINDCTCQMYQTREHKGSQKLKNLQRKELSEDTGDKSIIVTFAKEVMFSVAFVCLLELLFRKL